MCICSPENCKSPVEEAGAGSQAAAGLQCQATGTPGKRIQDRQIPQREQKDGAFESSEPDRSTNKDVVPKQKDQMEKAADDKIENGATPRTISAPLFYAGHPALFSFIHSLLFSCGMHFRRPDAR